MAEWWTEVWTDGVGRFRTYCGVARTETGYAVDLFVGDTCIASEGDLTHADAFRRAHAWRSASARPACLTESALLDAFPGGEKAKLFG